MLKSTSRICSRHFLEKCRRVRNISMIITQVDIWTVVVPVFPETVHSEEYGGYPDWARVPKQIIRLHTDEGFTGIGETGRGQSKESVSQAAEQLKNRDVMKMCLQNVFRQEPLKPTPEAPSQWEIDLWGKISSKNGIKKNYAWLQILF